MFYHKGVFLELPLGHLPLYLVGDTPLLERYSNQFVTWSLAEAVHRQTEGNPLFVQEVLRYFAEERLPKCQTPGPLSTGRIL